MEYFTFSGYEGKSLPAVLWRPEGEVRAVLQVTHGMTEHMGRYEALANYLAPMGVAVAGFDLRGHGKNEGDPRVAAMGDGGWEASQEDMRLFFLELERRFPGVPHYMLGFSLGSFLLREYLGKYPEGIAGAVIMGTGHQPGWLLSVMISIVKGEVKKAGTDATTDLVRQLSFGTYNAKFKPNRTCADWLCANDEELDRYLADPLVRRDISAGLFRDLLSSMKRTGGSCGSWKKDTPILLLAGQEDPVGDRGKGVQRFYDRMRKAGLQAVTFRFFPEARHDLLHEACAEQVCHCIADWLEGKH